ncbi:hypothetical protein AMTRI_Chr02g257470 [Amborella trichopoda]
MSVVGFDIGDENCVVAVAKQRGIEVVLNDESKRETPAIVSFGEKQRFLGSSGLASATMNPKSTVSQIKRLIGRKFNCPYAQRDLHFLPFATSEAPDGGILIHIPYMGETRVFTPVQVLAMLLSHLKQIAAKNLELGVTDCVIGIPSYFTDLQRRAYLEAAAIAGLKPLRLMHDGTATALAYGIYKTDFASSGGTNVVFVDIGHCDTQVCVASFEQGQFKVLAHAFDRDLGGRDFDEVLVDYFARKFKEEYKIDVQTNVRASIRLRAACEKLKRVLSANAEAPLNIECLMDEIDVKGFIKREEFEKLSAGLIERVQVPCEKALNDAGLGLERVHSVELVGSGSRIPAIARMLASFFKREPSRTLNASECVARGCALQCAMLSPIYRVRDYEVQDIFPFSIAFSSDEGPVSTPSSNILFPKGQPIPSVKMLTFHRSGTFCLEAFYANQSGLPPGTCQKISSFMLIEDDIDATDARGTAPLSTDDHEAHFPSRVSSDSVPNGGEKASDYAPVSTESAAEVQHSNFEGNRKGKPSRRAEIPVNETVSGCMSKAELAQVHEIELQLAHQDRVMELTKDRKNALEAYVYEIRNKLFDKYRSYASESEREGISRSLQQTEEWLYEEGDDESEKVYAAKLDELRKLVDPIENRFKDEEARPQAIRDLLNCIVDHRMAVQSLGTSERDAVINECNKAEQWLREKTQLQDALPKNVDPVLWSYEIKRRAEALDTACRQIMRPKSSPM